MIFIGIDPDVEKSGYAVWDKQDKSLYLHNYSFWEIIEDLESYNVPVTVIIEAGWLIKKSNWHNEKSGASAASRIGKNVGANHQVGKLLQEYCERCEIEHRLVKPKGKIKAEYFNKITGHTGKTNQDQRDAGMLVFGM